MMMMIAMLVWWCSSSPTVHIVLLSVPMGFFYRWPTSCSIRDSRINETLARLHKTKCSSFHFFFECPFFFSLIFLLEIIIIFFFFSK